MTVSRPAGPPTDVDGLRSRLRAQSNVRFLERSTYCKLLVAFRKLTRCDEPAAQLRGLHDSANGMKYVIEEERLRDSLS